MLLAYACICGLFLIAQQNQVEGSTCYDDYDQCLDGKIGSLRIGSRRAWKMAKRFCKQHEATVMPCLANKMKMEVVEEVYDPLHLCIKNVEGQVNAGDMQLLVRSSRLLEFICFAGETKRTDDINCFTQKIKECVEHFDKDACWKYCPDQILKKDRNLEMDIDDAEIGPPQIPNGGGLGLKKNSPNQEGAVTSATSQKTFVLSIAVGLIITLYHLF